MFYSAICDQTQNTNNSNKALWFCEIQCLLGKNCKCFNTRSSLQILWLGVLWGSFQASRVRDSSLYLHSSMWAKLQSMGSQIIKHGAEYLDFERHLQFLIRHRFSIGASSLIVSFYSVQLLQPEWKRPRLMLWLCLLYLQLTIYNCFVPHYGSLLSCFFFPEIYFLSGFRSHC